MIVLPSQTPQRFAVTRWAFAFLVSKVHSHNILVDCLLDTNQHELLSPWEPWSAGWGGLQASWNHNKQVNWTTHSITQSPRQVYRIIFSHTHPLSQKYKIPKALITITKYCSPYEPHISEETCQSTWLAQDPRQSSGTMTSLALTRAEPNSFAILLQTQVVSHFNSKFTHTFSSSWLGGWDKLPKSKFQILTTTTVLYGQK